MNADRLQGRSLFRRPSFGQHGIACTRDLGGWTKQAMSYSFHWWVSKVQLANTTSVGKQHRAFSVSISEFIEISSHNWIYMEWSYSIHSSFFFTYKKLCTDAKKWNYLRTEEQKFRQGANVHCFVFRCGTLCQSWWTFARSAGWGAELTYSITTKKMCYFCGPTLL